MNLLKIIIFVICAGGLLYVGYKLIRTRIKNNANIKTNKHITKQTSDTSEDINSNTKIYKKNNTIDIDNLLKDDDDNKSLLDICLKSDKTTETDKIKDTSIMSLKRKSRKKTDNTLRKIVNTILSNATIQKMLGIEPVDKFTKTYYKSIMIKMNLESGQMKIKDMLQAIMVSLPPIPVIENIIDENFSLNSIGNKEDKECIIAYLEK